MNFSDTVKVRRYTIKKKNKKKLVNKKVSIIGIDIGHHGIVPSLVVKHTLSEPETSAEL